MKIGDEYPVDYPGFPLIPGCPGAGDPRRPIDLTRELEPGQIMYLVPDVEGLAERIAKLEKIQEPPLYEGVRYIDRFRPEEFGGLPPTQRARANLVNNWLRHGVLRPPQPSRWTVFKAGLFRPRVPITFLAWATFGVIPKLRRLETRILQRLETPRGDAAVPLPQR